MQSPVFILIGAAAVMFLAIGECYTLDGIKSRTVSDGRHGTARWATKQEIKKPVPMGHSPPSSGGREKTCPTSNGSSWGVSGRRAMSPRWWTPTTSTVSWRAHPE